MFIFLNLSTFIQGRVRCPNTSGDRSNVRDNVMQHLENTLSVSDSVRKKNSAAVRRISSEKRSSWGSPFHRIEGMFNYSAGEESRSHTHHSRCCFFLFLPLSLFLSNRPRSFIFYFLLFLSESSSSRRSSCWECFFSGALLSFFF